MSADAVHGELLIDEAFGSVLVGSVPDKWREMDGCGRRVTGQWMVSLIETSENDRWVLQSSPGTPHFLVHTFPAQRGACVLRVRVRTPKQPKKRGISIGLSMGSPHIPDHRAIQLTFLGNGQLVLFSGMFNVYTLLPFWTEIVDCKPGEWLDLLIISDPLNSTLEVYVDGQKVHGGLLLFSNPVSEIDTLFFIDSDVDECMVDSVALSVSPAPPVPRGITTTSLSSSLVHLEWEKIVLSDIEEYRIYRAGVLVGTVPPWANFWRDDGLVAGKGYTYSVSAVDHQGRESLRSWARLVIMPPRHDHRRTKSGKREKEDNFDVMVLGGVPGSVAAAIAAARLGHTIALVSENDRLGGMASGGLSRTDFRYKQSAGGIFREFVDRSLAFYRTAYGNGSRQVGESNDGFFIEPSVAAHIFNSMIDDEPEITIFNQHRLGEVNTEIDNGSRVTDVTVTNLSTGVPLTLRAKVFIDCTYEGDLMAGAGVPYRVGREGKDEFGEEHAGGMFFDHLSQKILPASTHKADRQVQAYNYRPIITRRPDNKVDWEKPETYDRTEYVPLLDDIREGRVQRWEQVFSILRIPNEKFDVNNHPVPAISTDLPEENYDYPDSNAQRRTEIIKRHRDYILGLFWFLANDEGVPETIRKQGGAWGFAKDEFVENDNFPTQIYVREARRMEGMYTFNENDARVPMGGLAFTKGRVVSPNQERAPIHEDSIAVGDYPMDSHATQKKKPDDTFAEGFFYLTRLTRPYQIPFAVMIPKQVDGLIVVGAASATHIGFGTLRMEPVWMAMGAAAGTAAHLAIECDCPVRDLSVAEIQDMLVMKRHLITFFTDIDQTAKHFPATQFFGARGFFVDYEQCGDELIDCETAAIWMLEFTQMLNQEAEVPKSILASGEIRRSELAQWLMVVMEGAANWERVVPSTAYYHDVMPDHSSFSAIETLRHYGITSLDFTNVVVQPRGRRFAPDAPITRGEFCFLLWKAWRRAKGLR